MTAATGRPARWHTAGCASAVAILVFGCAGTDDVEGPTDGVTVTEEPAGSDDGSDAEPRWGDAEDGEDPSNDEGAANDGSADDDGSEADAPAVVPVLTIDAGYEDGDRLELHRLVWDAVLADDVATYRAAFEAIVGEGSATLLTSDGDVVAEGPVEVMADSFGGVSVSSYLIVDDGAESVDRLELKLDDGADLTVQRDGEVVLEVDVPPPGTLDPEATISWSASSGTAEARWLMGSPGLDGDGDPEVYGATGTAPFGSPSLPAEGGWLVVVASDGLAFDLVLAGPYHASEATGSPVEWRVFVEGDEVEDGDTLRIPLADETWYARVDVWVLPPGGGDVDPADIDATWTSDRQGT